MPVFTRVKVHRDFHVEVARSLYSAPKEYLGCHLDTRADSALVKLFHHGQLVKAHPRQQPGRRVTDPADLVPCQNSRISFDLVFCVISRLPFRIR